MADIIPFQNQDERSIAQFIEGFGLEYPKDAEKFFEIFFGHEDGEKPVGEIQELLGLPQAIVSQHLAKMRGWGIVEPRREGIHVYYRILEPKVQHILDCIRRCDV